MTRIRSAVVDAAKAVLRSRLVRLLAVVLALAVLVWLLRRPLLRGLGAFLVAEDPPCRVDAVYVLGGSAENRGEEAARVYQAGWGRRFTFSGEPVPGPLRVEGIERTEAQQTRDVAVRHGLPDSLARAVNVGTSTWEESNFILAEARANGYDTIMIISSSFHLRRIRYVFRERAREEGITVVLHGARNGEFDDAAWWRSEDGLMMVNNEYVKLAYYLLKY